MKEQMLIIKGAPCGAPFLKIIIADSFLTRLKGLMFQKALQPATGLLLAPCNSVHMCFMRFAIDVVYLDERYNVIKVVNNLKPWTGLSICRKAWAALELNAGEAEKYGFEVGRVLIREKDELT